MSRHPAVRLPTRLPGAPGVKMPYGALQGKRIDYGSLTKAHVKIAPHRRIHLLEAADMDHDGVPNISEAR